MDRVSELEGGACARGFEDDFEHIVHLYVDRLTGGDKGDAGSVVVNQIFAEGAAELVPSIIARIANDLLAEVGFGSYRGGVGDKRWL